GEVDRTVAAGPRHAVRVTVLLARQARAVAALGTILAIGGWWWIPVPPFAPWTTVAIAFLAFLLRWRQIPLTKYSTLHLLGPLGVIGSVVGGVTPTVSGI